MESFHGDDIYPHNINKHSCTYQSLPEHQVSKLCEYLTKRHIKSYQHMGGLNAFSNYVKTTLKLGQSLKEDWGGNIDPMLTGELMELTQMKNISEVDWGDHGSSSNHMTEFLLSEVDWGAHNSSFFLYLVNIDYDAKPMEFFTQGLWGELQQNMSSTPLIEHMTDSLDTSQTEDDAFNPKPIDPELDESEQLTGESSSPISPW